jgi:predicted membrane protein
MSGGSKFDNQRLQDELRDHIYQATLEKLKAKSSRSASPSGLIPGIILIVVGTIFLLDHMGIIHGENLWRFWPLAIVGVGILKFTKEGERSVGAGFILVGIIVQLYKLGIVGLSWDTIWPFLLIVGGASMIWSRFEMPKIPGLQGSLVSNGRDTLNEHALFGGVERRVNINNFRGGMITAVFGGVEVDFRSADIDGEEAVIFVEAIFGGIELTIPDRWNVSFQGQSIFAGFTDETRGALPDPSGATLRKTLVLQGRAVFGGITVKN